MNPVYNDFSMRIATINGTGSQSANNIIFKTLFRMGIPASAKNIFPSNIKGLPTWFQIRVSPKGYQSYRETSEIAIWMNPNTLEDDLFRAPQGGVVIYNSDEINASPLKKRRDLVTYPIPISSMTKEKVDKPKLRPLLANMIYVGAVAELMGLDVQVLNGVVKDTFANKESVVKVNLDLIQAGIDYTRQNLTKKDPYTFKTEASHQNKITIEGNTACALGAIYGGCTFLSWYPITPSSSLAEAMQEYWKRFGHEANGKSKYCVVQAEDELAAIGMTIGAGWAGARAMTTTSGPGMSLMTEFSGYAYYAEIPTVVVDVQRVGPSTGLPTRTQQGDLTFVSTLSHGDTQHPMLFPATPVECFQLTLEAFNFAEEFQTPIFVMTDLDIGMNLWISEDLPFPTQPFRRGKVLKKEDFEKGASFARYADIDGDGIPYRTLPFTPSDGAAYFTRGSGHSESAGYTESPEIYERVMTRLGKKFKTIESKMPEPLIHGTGKIGLLGIGSSAYAMQESVDQLAPEGVSLKTCRPLAYPFGPKVGEFLRSCEKVYVVDQNRDAQLLQLLTLSFPDQHAKLSSVRYYTGLPIPANAITRQVLRGQGKSHVAFDFVPVVGVEAD
jgi:2-oxoglutarate ferredoxin oxidoreductase subunit alpha